MSGPLQSRVAREMEENRLGKKINLFLCCWLFPQDVDAAYLSKAELQAQTV